MPPPISSTVILCVWILALVWPFSIGYADDSKEPRLPLAMEVFLKKPKDHLYDIHIHLTNISQNSVTVDVRDLPWNPPNDSKWLVATRLNVPHTPIQQEVRPWKFGSRKVQLMPGESIQDTIALNPRIPTLLEDIDQSGVQLQWDCPPPSLKFVCKSGSSTTITIPKEDPGQQDVHPIDTKACRTLEQTIGLISIPQDHQVLFLLTPKPVMEDLKKVQSLLLQVDDYVRQCQPMWTNSWAASFFTEPEVAGFLTDEKSGQYFKEGQWQDVNIGQYSSQIRTLFRFPWIKKKSDIVYLSVYRLRQESTARLRSHR